MNRLRFVVRIVLGAVLAAAGCAGVKPNAAATGGSNGQGGTSVTGSGGSAG